MGLLGYALRRAVSKTLSLTSLINFRSGPKNPEPGRPTMCLGWKWSAVLQMNKSSLRSPQMDEQNGHHPTDCGFWMI